eukprot:s794_g12.t1
MNEIGKAAQRGKKSKAKAKAKARGRANEDDFEILEEALAQTSDLSVSSAAVSAPPSPDAGAARTAPAVCCVADCRNRPYQRSPFASTHGLCSAHWKELLKEKDFLEQMEAVGMSPHSLQWPVSSMERFILSTYWNPFPPIVGTKGLRSRSFFSALLRYLETLKTPTSPSLDVLFTLAFTETIRSSQEWQMSPEEFLHTAAIGLLLALQAIEDCAGEVPIQFQERWQQLSGRQQSQQGFQEDILAIAAFWKEEGNRHKQQRDFLLAVDSYAFGSELLEELISCCGELQCSERDFPFNHCWEQKIFTAIQLPISPPVARLAADLANNASAAYIDVEDYPNAEQFALSAISYFDQLTDEALPKKAKAFYRRGVALHRLGRLQESVTDLTCALRICPEDEQIRNRLVIVQGELERAEIPLILTGFLMLWGILLCGTLGSFHLCRSCSVIAMGNKACGALSGRKPHTPEPAPTATSEGSSGSAVAPAAGRRRSESLEWLNDLVLRLWPKIDLAVQKIIHDQVTPQLQESLPGPFKGTYFKTFSLGQKTPRLGPIQVCQREDGLKLILDVDYQSDMHIDISAVVASIGVKSISLKGQLMIRLGPLIDEMPVVGGLTAYFNDCPELDLNFTGVGNVADMPVLYGLIKKQISQAINSAIVLPNCIAVPLATEQQGVDPALLGKPKPLAVLRATALRASKLPAMDWNLVGKASSDPFVKVTVANDSWSSSVVKQSCNPTWTDQDVHNFVVFDCDQHIWLEVYDKDMLSSSDLIGKARPLKVSNAMAESEKDLQLSDGSKSCGSLQMKFQWLTLSDEVSPNMAGCVVMVEVQQLMAKEAASMVAKLGSQEMRTDTLGPSESVEPSEEQKLRSEVARRCRAAGLDEAATVKISGLSKSDLAALDTHHVPGPIEFQSIFYLSVPRKSLEDEELTLTALNAKQKPFAEGVLKMSELLEKKSLRLERLQLRSGEGSEAATCCSMEDSSAEGGEIAASIRVKIFGLTAAAAA